MTWPSICISGKRQLNEVNCCTPQCPNYPHSLWLFSFEWIFERWYYFRSNIYYSFFVCLTPLQNRYSSSRSRMGLKALLNATLYLGNILPVAAPGHGSEVVISGQLKTLQYQHAFYRVEKLRIIFWLILRPLFASNLNRVACQGDVFLFSCLPWP